MKTSHCRGIRGFFEQWSKRFPACELVWRRRRRKKAKRDAPLLLQKGTFSMRMPFSTWGSTESLINGVRRAETQVKNWFHMLQEESGRQALPLCEHLCLKFSLIPRRKTWTFLMMERHKVCFHQKRTEMIKEVAYLLCSSSRCYSLDPFPLNMSPTQAPPPFYR